MTQTILVRPGIELAVEVVGEGEPVVLIMGIGAQMILWPAGFIDGLVARGFQVIRFDNRDVGKSTWLDGVRAPHPLTAMSFAMAGLPVSAPYTLWDMADDTAELIRALGHESAHVVGISMGGMIAQSLAIRHPSRVRSLVSMHSTTGSRFHSIGKPTAYGALLASRPTNRDEAAEHIVRLYQRIGSPRFPNDPDELREMGKIAFDRGANPSGFLRQWAAILASGNRAYALRSVQAPSMVVHGSADPLVPVRAGRHTAANLPGCHLEVIDGMGHDLPPSVHTRILDRIAWNAQRSVPPRT